MNCVVCDSKIDLGRRGAESAVVVIRQAIDRNGGARVVFSTGASQFENIDALVQMPDVDWSRVTGFHLDEYLGMSESHPASFRRYLRERLLGRLPQQPAAFHFIEGDGDGPAECRRQEQLLREAPIDLAFVGIGENAHLAFNDPPADFNTTAGFHVVTMDEGCRRQQLGEGWFATLDDVPRQAISITVPEILKSQHIICCVPDARKAKAIQATIEGPITPQVPASILQRHEHTTIFLDPDSASLRRT